MNDDLTTVILFGGTDREAQTIIERELTAAGIPYFVEGSVVYGVQVHSQDVARARQILTATRELKDHWVRFPSD
jgi:hypothetical protein